MYEFLSSYRVVAEHKFLMSWHFMCKKNCGIKINSYVKVVCIDFHATRSLSKTSLILNTKERKKSSKLV